MPPSLQPLRLPSILSIPSQASTSYQRVCLRHGGHRLGRHVCRVTNLGEEKPATDPRLRVPPRYMRDGATLNETVSEDMFDGAADDAINLADMEYWFRDDPSDYEEERFLEKAEQIANVDFTVRNEDWESAPLHSLHEGQVLTGTIDTLHLLHGAVVDLGCEWHGMIPVTEPEWPAVLDALSLGTQVEVRVHKIRDPEIFRFPIQLAVTDPATASHLVDPNEYRPPIHIGPDADPAKYIAAAYPDYVVATIRDDQNLGTEGMDDIAFDEAFGSTAPKPALDWAPDGGEVDIDFETWRTTEVLDVAFAGE